MMQRGEKEIIIIFFLYRLTLLKNKVLRSAPGFVTLEAIFILMISE